MTIDVSEREALDRVLADFRSSLHTSFPAQVTAYDASKQTVDVKAALKREFASDDPERPWETEELPELFGIQIQWPRAGGFAITFPIAVGDWVHVHCAVQSTLVWRRGGQPGSEPGVNDPHGLNGCVAVPGWYPDTQKLTSVDTSNLVLRSVSNGVRITISDDEISLGSTSGDKFVALAPDVEAAIEHAIKHHTHTVSGVTAGGASVTSVVGVLTADVQSTAATMVKAK
jgi:hypothetical protein